MKFKIVVFVSIFCFLMSKGALSQTDSLNFNELTKEQILKMSYDELLNLPLDQLMMLSEKLGVSVEELLEMKITVASKNELTPRESPNIISVITAEEIQKSGVRDLQEALRLVPGFGFGWDSDGGVGPSFRGMWGQEGKVLIQIDGQMINDLLFLCNVFGNHFDLSNVKRIEIVRGPGSALYGGSAELSVINIITNTGEDLNGIGAGSTFSVNSDKLTRQNYTFNAGKKKGDLDLSISGFYGEALLNTKGYDLTKYYGVNWGDSVLPHNFTKNINVGLNYKNLKVRFIYDHFQMQAYYDELYQEKFNNYIADISYAYKPTNKITLTPKFQYRYNEPWYNFSGPEYHRQITRATGSLNANVTFTPNLNVLAGAEFYQDNGKYQNPAPDTLIVFYNGKPELKLNNFILYAQAILKTKIVNVTLGARFENNNLYGSAFAPRVGVTKIINNFNFKILYSRAFHTPAIGNIIYDKNIKPEFADISEVELGYKIGKYMFINANLFNIHLKDGILWYDEGFVWGYKNSGDVENRGVELEYRIKQRIWYATLNYSFYTSSVNDSVAIKYWRVPLEDQKNMTLGNPQHKISFNGSFSPFEKFSISPSFIYTSKLYSYTDLDDDGNPVIEKINGQFVANLYFTYSGLFVKGLNMSLGVNDLFNKNYPLYQSYNGWLPPLQGRGREFTFKLSYNFRLKGEE